VVRIAKIKRDDLLGSLRVQAGVVKADSGSVTLSEVRKHTEAYYAALSTYQEKPRSLDYRKELLDVLERTLPNKKPSKWTKIEITQWWTSKEVIRYSANRRNNLLGALRKLVTDSISFGCPYSLE